MKNSIIFLVSEEYGKVHEVHSIQNRDIVFVHIDEKAPELAMVGLNGQDYDGRKLKIEYGTLQDKPHYDKRAPKVLKTALENRLTFVS